MLHNLICVEQIFLKLVQSVVLWDRTVLAWESSVCPVSTLDPAGLCHCALGVVPFLELFHFVTVPCINFSRRVDASF